MSKETVGAPAFDIDHIDTVDQAEMVVISNDRPTSWVWTFAGPGHPKAIELAQRLSRERLHREAAKEQAQVNGRKWKADEDTPDDLARRNAEYITDRLIGWSPVKLSGQDYPFTRENAIKLLVDPRKGALALQALEFLADQKSFTKRSATA